jgi:alpha-L-fucosidase 2
MKNLWDRGSGGWRQDDIFMAYLGMTDEAKRNIVARSRSHDGGSRFPAFWGPNYDWIPDQDHGGVLMKAFQSMVMQAEPATGSEYDGKIYLLPAWPKDWDVDFKLHAPKNTTVEGSYRNGKIEKLVVTPESRRKDVVISP